MIVKIDVKDRKLYKWNNEDYDLNMGYCRYINIDNLENEELKEIIVNNSNVIGYNEALEELTEHLKKYDDIDLTKSCEIDGEHYNNGYEMLSEIDEVYYRLSSILEEFENKTLTLELDEHSRQYYKFIYDNFETIEELKDAI